MFVTKFNLFIHSLLHYQHTFSTFMWDAVAACLPVCAESVRAPHACCVSVHFHPQSASIMGPERYKSEAAKSVLQGGWGRAVHPIVAVAFLMHSLVLSEEAAFIDCPVRLNPSDTFNACTYHFELVMARLSKTSTNRVTSLFQKTCHGYPQKSTPWLFFHGDNCGCHSIDCSSVGRNDEPRFHCQ